MLVAWFGQLEIAVTYPCVHKVPAAPNIYPGSFREHPWESETRIEPVEYPYATGCLRVSEKGSLLGDSWIEVTQFLICYSNNLKLIIIICASEYINNLIVPL